MYLGLLTLDISKIAMYYCCYVYKKLKCRDNAKIRYMDTNSFLAQVKTEDVYIDIATDVKNN